MDGKLLILKVKDGLEDMQCQVDKYHKVDL